MHTSRSAAAVAVLAVGALLVVPSVALGFAAWSAAHHSGLREAFSKDRGKASRDRSTASVRPSSRASARAKKRVRKHPVQKRVRVRRQHTHRATQSYYVRTLSGRKMARRGCRTARRQASGIVILAFGRLYARGGVYGTQTFGGDFASNPAITTAMKTFARSYARCLPRRSRARIVLARGTSNYSPAVPSTFRAGWGWARQAVALARFLEQSGLRRHVRSAAAIDAEPAWNRGFRRTRNFFRGYRAGRPGIVLYNFGSLDGGVGRIWNARQVWFVSSGMRYARMIPEIYYPGMAEQWAAMSRLAVGRYGRPIRFAGVMTQHRAVPGCACGYWPGQAHRLLVRALRAHPKTRVGRLPMTNIRWK